MKRERKSVIPKKDYSARRLIDTSDEKFQNSPGLQQWATIENLKIAAQSYNEVGSLSDLKHQITVKTEAGKSAKQSAVKLEHRMKGLAEIIKYAEQYKTNRSYHIAYKKSKNPDAYFRRYESQLILYGGARHVLEQTGINLKGLNVDKLKAKYQELMKQIIYQSICFFWKMHFHTWLTIHSCPNLHFHITFLCEPKVMLSGVSGKFFSDHSATNSGCTAAKLLLISNPLLPLALLYEEKVLAPSLRICG